jgi:hypothetical protein
MLIFLWYDMNDIIDKMWGCTDTQTARWSQNLPLIFQNQERILKSDYKVGALHSHGCENLKLKQAMLTTPAANVDVSSRGERQADTAPFCTDHTPQNANKANFTQSK